MDKLQKITLKAKGLYTWPNQLDAPEGALGTAWNVRIDRPGVIESAYHYTTLLTLPSSDTFSSGSPALKPLFENQGFLTSGTANAYVAANVAGALTAATVRVYNASGTSSYYAMQSAGKAFEYGRNIFTVTSTNGDTGYSKDQNIRTTYTGGISRGGGLGIAVAKTGRDYTGTVGGLAAATVLYNQSQIAYRFVYLCRDSNNALVVGGVSGRQLVFNGAGATYTYGMQVPLPKYIYAGDILQVYRSETKVTTSAGEPSDNMRQCFEYIVASGDVSNGYVVFNDPTVTATGASATTPGPLDDLRGAELYTNDSQEGILQSNSRPPRCDNALIFKDTAFYSGGWNGMDWGHYTTLTFLGVANWVANTTAFVINGHTYTAKATESLSNKEFKLYTGGSASQNNVDTMRSLIRCINFNETDYQAEYVSDGNSTNAILALYTAGNVGASVSTAIITSANVPAGTVAPSMASGGGCFLIPFVQANYVVYSKLGQPEATPKTNYIPVGSALTGVSAMIALRDSLFIFKPEGLFRLSGTDETTFRVELFDSTIRMSFGVGGGVATVGNRIMCLCNQGVAAITESGSTIVSNPIQDLIVYFEQAFSTPSDYRGVVGWGNETERKYYLHLGEINGVAAGDIMFAYNIDSEAWTSLSTFPGQAGSGIQAGCSAPIPYTAGSSTIETNLWVDTTISTTTVKRYYMLSDATTTTGTVAHYASEAEFSYTNETCGNGGVTKLFNDVRFVLTGSTNISTLTVEFDSDSGASAESVTVTLENSSAPQEALVQVPRAHSRASQLTITVTGPATVLSSYNGNLMVSECVLTYTNDSDRLPQARG